MADNDYPKLPKLGTNQFPGDGIPVKVRIKQIGETELARFRGEGEYGPFQVVAAQVVIDEAWVDHDWFPPARLYTSLLALEQKMGERFAVGSIVEVSRFQHANSTQWKLKAAKADGAELAFDSFADSTATPLTKPTPPLPETGPTVAQETTSGGDVPMIQDSPPSVGTAIVEHYTSQAFLSNERLREKHGKSFPKLTAEALNAQAATAIIADQKRGVDQAALVLLPGYPIGMTGTEQEAKEETPPGDAGVTADDIPF